jgi:hypothetical protein
MESDKMRWLRKRGIFGRRMRKRKMNECDMKLGKLQNTAEELMTAIEQKKKRQKEMKLVTDQYFLPNVKLLIPSSRQDVGPLFDIVLTGGEEADVDDDIDNELIELVRLESTSTTFTTALPSRTFLTLSASRPFFDDDDPPENASQNALPSLDTKVWLASAATMISFCACWMSFLPGAAAAGRGDGGTEAAELYAEEPLLSPALDLPESMPDSELPGIGGEDGEGEEGVVNLPTLAAKNDGRSEAARPVGRAGGGAEVRVLLVFWDALVAFWAATSFQSCIRYGSMLGYVNRVESVNFSNGVRLVLVVFLRPSFLPWLRAGFRFSWRCTCA